MAILSRHFQKFHSNIKLKSDRVSRIQSAYASLRSFVQTDDPLKSRLHEMFLQGSYCNHTAIRPVTGYFDVDVVMAIDATNYGNILTSPFNPSAILKWVADRLRENPSYGSNNISVRQKNRCIRVNYAGDFHLDIVPAHSDGNTHLGVYIPNRSEDEWVMSHPKGYSEWCYQTNERTNGRFTRTAKMMKWWVSNKFDDKRAPKSILLQALLGESMPANPSSDAEALANALGCMDLWLQNQWPADMFGPPTVSNPAFGRENLARDWVHDDYLLFKKRIHTAAGKACQAYQEDDVQKSIQLWREMFGDEFPVKP